jgi:AcrR family transcriptional regulator
MARAKSEDKRRAILAAAEEVIGEQGTGAPTARIARRAGVAEGTLFTYFATKDELLNQLYLELKGGLRDAMMTGYPHAGTLRERTRHLWGAYVGWGVVHPHGGRALAQLKVSDRITDETRAEGSAAFAEMEALIARTVADGPLRDAGPAFVGALMGSMADTTMEFIARQPDAARRFTEAGFDAFWRAVDPAG